jgi:leucyl/phenylalanyl-tRNA---protein transferase
MIPLLGANEDFPPTHMALRDPNGLLCVGGDLSPQRLVRAYQRGIFPWFNEDDPILWWTPQPRCVFITAEFHLPNRLLRTVKKSNWRIRANHNFAGLMSACGAPRAESCGTWISPQMLKAYARLNELGYAHSIEIYDSEVLAGGIYGVGIDRMFFGESMCSLQPGASKAALFVLCKTLSQHGVPLLDAQVESAHLQSLGAQTMSRANFELHLSHFANSQKQFTALDEFTEPRLIRELL